MTISSTSMNKNYMIIWQGYNNKCIDEVWKIETRRNNVLIYLLKNKYCEPQNYQIQNVKVYLRLLNELLRFTTSLVNEIENN